MGTAELGAPGAGADVPPHHKQHDCPSESLRPPLLSPSGLSEHEPSGSCLGLAEQHGDQSALESKPWSWGTRGGVFPEGQPLKDPMG